jgi:very-short-patch-repair endonuclease
MSPPEVLVWQRLRLRPCGVKFRRQHPVGAYVADFYAVDARMIVEVDGLAHDARVERDAGAMTGSGGRGLWLCAWRLRMC